MKGRWLLDLLEAILLGIVQGATEFLPVSSSGHLVLVSWWLGYGTPPLVYSVVVHLGTTLAVLLYFWRDWKALFISALQTLKTRQLDLTNNPEQRLLFLLLIGTLPAAIIGVLFADFFEAQFSEPAIVSVSLWVTAGLLVYGERVGNSEAALELEPLAIKSNSALFIGFAQALAIMPGISRSGSTIAAGLFRSLSRTAATRYSFLLATPIIIGAGLKQTLDVITGDVLIEDGLGLALLAGFVSSAIIGYICIAFMLRFVRRQSLYGFALYCVVFGTISLGAVIIRG